MKKYSVCLVFRYFNEIEMEHEIVEARNEFEALGIAIDYCEKTTTISNFEEYGLIQHSVIEIETSTFIGYDLDNSQK